MGQIATLQTASTYQRRAFDLLTIGIVKRTLHWRGFPYVFQATLLAAFVIIAWLGWGHYTPEGVPDKLYAKSNLVNLLVWGLWWPAMVWTAVLFGRVWCMVCPLELVSNAFERAGRSIGIPQRNLPRALRAGWLIVAAYFAIQMLVAGVHLHRVPMYTALFMIVLLLAAAMTGLIFRDRAFCRGFCPVGLLLGTYGRGGMIAVRAGIHSACATCSSRACNLSDNRDRLDARSCPSLLNPPKLNSNKDCLVCGQCIKSCGPDNMQLLVRPPFSLDDSRDAVAPWPVAIFVMVLSGFVTFEVIGAWPKIEEAMLWPAAYVAEEVLPFVSTGWIEGLWCLAIVPIALWLLLGLIATALGEVQGIGETWRRIALPMAVIISSVHMAKGIEKIATWGGFLPGALQEPLGVHTAMAIGEKIIASPGPLLPHIMYATIGVFLIALGLRYALRESRIANGTLPRSHAIQLAVVAVLLAVCVTGWGFR